MVCTLEHDCTEQFSSRSVCRNVILITMFEEQADLLEGGAVVVVAAPAGAHQVVDVRRAHCRFVQENLKVHQ